MSDATIGSSLPPVPQASQQADPTVAKIISLPPGMTPGQQVNGEVVSNEDGQIALKTDQGMVVIEGDIDVAVGQKVSLKLQNAAQQATNTMLLELLDTATQTPIRTIPVRTPQLQNAPVQNAPLPNVPAQDNVTIPQTGPVREYAPIQAQLVSLPDTLPDETLQLLVKTILTLPVDKMMPVTLSEGFEKFQQLKSLLNQANFLPAQSLQPQQNAAPPQNLLASLQQLLKPVAAGQVESHPLLSQLPQNFIQLQTIMPGQKLSPDILLNIRQQLLSILQPQQQADAKLPGVMQKLTSLLPNALNNVLPKIMPQTAPQQAQQAAEPHPLFTMPAIGMVLGPAKAESPAIPGAHLVFMATPGGQQLVGLLGADHTSEAAKPLLPGTVFVVAFRPQENRIVTLPVMPAQISAADLESIQPLMLSLGETWPALKDLWDAAISQQNVHPEVINALRQIIPAPTPQHMPPALLFFMAVLKNGFADSWIPEKHFEGLDKIGKADLLRQLAQDMNALQNRLNDDGPVDRWQPLPVPMQIGDQLVRLQFFYRHPQDEREYGADDEMDVTKKKRKTRFLLDVPKTTVGDIQLDGLVQEKDLEIILRTENPVSSHMEQAIRSRYHAVLETTGMAGNIMFQSGRQHYVRA